jgi:hypothetical protein
MQRSKKNDRDHSQESVEKCAQKEFDRADIVRDVRLMRLPGATMLLKIPFI